MVPTHPSTRAGCLLPAGDGGLGLGKEAVTLEGGCGAWGRSVCRGRDSGPHPEGLKLLSLPVHTQFRHKSDNQVNNRQSQVLIGGV